MAFLYRCFKLQQRKVLRFKMATFFPEFDLFFTVWHLQLRRGQDSSAGLWQLYVPKRLNFFFFSTCENQQHPLPPNLTCRRVKNFSVLPCSQSSPFSRPGWEVVGWPEKSYLVIRLDLEEIKGASLFQARPIWISGSHVILTRDVISTVICF